MALCWVSWCLMSLCWVLLYWVSLCWVSYRFNYSKLSLLKTTRLWEKWSQKCFEISFIRKKFRQRFKIPFWKKTIFKYLENVVSILKRSSLGSSQKDMWINNLGVNSSREICLSLSHIVIPDVYVLMVIWSFSKHLIWFTRK
jgi:hypothetical protein